MNAQDTPITVASTNILTRCWKKKKKKKDFRRENILIVRINPAREIHGLRVSSLGAVLSPNKVRVIHELTFDWSEESRKRGVKSWRSVDDSPLLLVFASLTYPDTVADCSATSLPEETCPPWGDGFPRHQLGGQS